MFSLNWMWVELNEIKITHENIISKHSDCLMCLWQKFLELHRPSCPPPRPGWAFWRTCRILHIFMNPCSAVVQWFVYRERNSIVKTKSLLPINVISFVSFASVSYAVGHDIIHHFLLLWMLLLTKMMIQVFTKWNRMHKWVLHCIKCAQHLSYVDLLIAKQTLVNISYPHIFAAS